MKRALLIICILLAGCAHKPVKPAEPVAAGPMGETKVLIETSMGDIKAELYDSKAPITVANFRDYIAGGLYEDTIFHRVIPGFMIQGGGFDVNMREGMTYAPIENEAHNGLKNRRGTLAMARTNVIDSATSQFFINLNDNFLLDHGKRDYGYAVFGRVIEGMEIVDRIAAVRTGSRGMHQDVPLEPVIIRSIRIIEE